jgi:hypothetical protein
MNNIMRYSTVPVAQIKITLGALMRYRYLIRRNNKIYIVNL